MILRLATLLSALNAMNISSPNQDDGSLMGVETTTIVSSVHNGAANHLNSNRNSYSNFKPRYDRTLPIFHYREQILREIHQNPILITRGGTGSGKTTQVPLFIMDACHSQGLRFNCVVTQPRTIAATSICKYVNRFRGLEEGRLIGYKIGLDQKVTDGETQLTFMTTGVLLKHLIENKSLDNFTHIILDEIHERDKDSDFAMILVKRLRSMSKRTKIILMSATCDTQLFQDYLVVNAGRPQPPPCIEVEGQEYDVKVEYWTDLCVRFPAFKEKLKEITFCKSNPADCAML